MKRENQKNLRFKDSIEYQLGQGNFAQADKMLNLSELLTNPPAGVVDQLREMDNIFHYLVFDPYDNDDDPDFMVFLQKLRSEVLSNIDSIFTLMFSVVEDLNDIEISEYWFRVLDKLITYLSENHREQMDELVDKIYVNSTKIMKADENILSVSKLLFLYLLNYFSDFIIFSDDEQEIESASTNFNKLKEDLHSYWLIYFGFSNTKIDSNTTYNIESLPKVWGNYDQYKTELTSFLKNELKNLGFLDVMVEQFLYTYIDLGLKENANEYNFANWVNHDTKIARMDHIRSSILRLLFIKNTYGIETVNNLYNDFGITQFLHLSNSQAEEQKKVKKDKIWFVVARSYEHFDKSISRTDDLKEQLNSLGYPDSMVQFEIDQSAVSIKRFIKRAKNFGKPDLIIFSGHGSVDALEIALNKGIVRSYMLGDNNDQLGRIVESICSDSTELVLLACSAHGIASKLAGLGFPLVLSSSDKVDGEVIKLKSDGEKIQASEVKYFVAGTVVETRTFSK